MELQLVGRDQEMAHIRALIEESGCLVLAGPAGIGKTRLTDEAAGLAAARGMAVETITGSATARTLLFGASAHLIPRTGARSAHELITAAATAVETRARQSGLLVVVDDAQLLDAASATLVARIATDGVTAVLVTIRTIGEAGPDAIVALWSDRGAPRLDLQPLERPQVRALAESELGGEIGAQLEAALWRLSRGYPMFIREVLLAGRATGAIARKDGIWRLFGTITVSTRLVDLVRSRLNQLPAAVRDATESLAVAEPMARAVADTVIGPDLLHEQEQQGLVDQEQHGDTQLMRLAHPLYGEALRAGLTPTRHAVLLNRWAGVVARLAPVGAGDLMRTAALLLEAGHDPEPALALPAAREALARFEGALAERLTRITLDRAPDTTGKVTTMLGVALQMQGRLDEAETVLGQALDLADGDAQRIEIVLARARARHWAVGDRVGAQDLIREALEGIEDPAFMGMLEAELALYYAVVGDMRRAGVTASQALGRPDLPPHTELNALIVLTLVQSVLGQRSELNRDLPRALELAATCAADEPLAEDQLLLSQAHALIFDDVAPMRLLCSDRVGLASPMEGMWRATAGLCEQATGAIADAVNSLREAVHVLERTDPFGNLPMVRCMYSLMAAQSGDAVLAGDELAAADPKVANLEPRARVWFRRAEAWLCALSGDHRTAAGLAVRAGENAIADGYVAWGAAALHDAVRMGGADLSLEALGAVAQRTDLRVVRLFAEHAVGVVERDPDRLDEAAAGFLARGHVLAAVETLTSISRMVAQDDARRGHALLRAGLLATRCRGAWSIILDDQGVSLSDREAQVVRLAARGVGNREIAAQLYLSPRTVENHLSRVYHRCGLSGRGDLRRILNDGFFRRMT